VERINDDPYELHTQDLVGHTELFICNFTDSRYDAPSNTENEYILFPILVLGLLAMYMRTLLLKFGGICYLHLQGKSD
jgi:hypothetical protein